MTSHVLASRRMTVVRHMIITLGVVATLLTAYLATSHCCERLNIFAVVGITAPG